MPLVLGLQFGHDASVAVIRDGEVLGCLLAERPLRLKHATGLTADLVIQALAACGCRDVDVDYVAVTNSQNLPYAFSDSERMSFKYVAEPQAWCRAHVAPASLAKLARLQTRIDPHDRMWRYYAGRLSFGDAAAPHTHLLDNIQTFGYLDAWRSLKTTERQAAANVRGLVGADSALPWMFHLPILFRLDGREIPGAVFAHHLAHAATSFYQSAYDRAGIITWDGAGDFAKDTYLGGMYFYGQGNKIYPLFPHCLPQTAAYAQVAETLFDNVFASGKVMGLAPYGRPTMVDRLCEGTYFDGPLGARPRLAEGWVRHALSRARPGLYADGAVPEPETVLGRDLAASIQAYTEANSLRAVDVLWHVLGRSGLATDHLCLSGGGALNCPANTRIAEEGGFGGVFVPPACDDGGLAIGSALLLCHHILDLPRVAANQREMAPAYLGREYDDSTVAAALAAAGDRIQVREGDAADHAAAALAQDRLIGWFEGRSEVGPRALGHRSILAHPGKAANWRRVNDAKQREHWRPFAPAVLAGEADRWFREGPRPSPYMLFTAQVRGGTCRRSPMWTAAPGSRRSHRLVADIMMSSAASMPAPASRWSSIPRSTARASRWWKARRTLCASFWLAGSTMYISMVAIWLAAKALMELEARNEP